MDLDYKLCVFYLLAAIYSAISQKRSQTSVNVQIWSSSAFQGCFKVLLLWCYFLSWLLWSSPIWRKQGNPRCKKVGLTKVVQGEASGGLKMQDSKRIPQKNLNAWWFKLIVCPYSAIHFEIVSLSLSEIWQPWYANFGNPEIQIMVPGFFYYVYAKSKVHFDFQGCHLFSNLLILCLYGNPELKFSFSSCLNLKLLNYMLFIQNLFKKPRIYFYSST